MQVPQHLVRELEDLIFEELPDLKIVYKDEEGWQNTSVFTWVIWAFFTYLIRPFSKENHDLFMTRFSNALPGNVMVLPSRATHGDWSNFNVFVVVYHEVKHLLDMKKYPVWFVVSYILLLPILLTMRAFWEVRGYTASMLAVFKITGTVRKEMPPYLANHFVGSMYFFMFPFRETITKILEARRQRILKGEIKDLASC